MLHIYMCIYTYMYIYPYLCRYICAYIKTYKYLWFATVDAGRKTLTDYVINKWGSLGRQYIQYT